MSTGPSSSEEDDELPRWLSPLFDYLDFLDDVDHPVGAIVGCAVLVSSSVLFLFGFHILLAAGIALAATLGLLLVCVNPITELALRKRRYAQYREEVQATRTRLDVFRREVLTRLDDGLRVSAWRSFRELNRNFIQASLDLDAARSVVKVSNRIAPAILIGLTLWLWPFRSALAIISAFALLNLAAALLSGRATLRPLPLVGVMLSLSAFAVYLLSVRGEFENAASLSATASFTASGLFLTALSVSPLLALVAYAVGFLAGWLEVRFGRGKSYIYARELLAIESLDLLGDLVESDGFAEEAERLNYSGRLSLLADVARHGLPTLMLALSSRGGQTYQAYCNNLAATIEDHQLDSVLSERKSRAEICQFLRSLIAAFVLGEEKSLTLVEDTSDRIRTESYSAQLKRFSRSLAVALLPAGTYFGAQRLGFEFPAEFTGTASVVVGVWAVATLLLAIDPNLEKRMNAATTLVGLLRGTGDSTKADPPAR